MQLRSRARSQRLMHQRGRIIHTNVFKQFMHKKASRNIFLENWIDSGWLELIEDFPDRFLIGTDAHSNQQYRKYVKVIRSGLLSNLSPSAARKVAHENAQYLFGLQ